MINFQNKAETFTKLNVKKNNNIQVLRAFAAIIVVLYHSIVRVDILNLPYSDYENIFLECIHKSGAFGVDVFFVISGYLMFMVQEKKHRGPIKFMEDRIIRIVPLYWLLTFVAYLLFIFFPSYFNSTVINFQSFVASLFFISTGGGLQPALNVGWTLEFEMLFYVIFAFLLLNKSKLGTIFILLIITFLILIFVFKLNTIVIEFAFGGFAYFFMKKIDVKKNNYFLFLSLFAIVLVILFPKYGNERFIFLGIPALILFISVLLVRDMTCNLLIDLGNASYSIYLIHVFTVPIIGKILVTISPEFNGTIAFFIISILSIILGYFSYLYIETKLNLGIKYLISRPLKKRFFHLGDFF